MEMVAVDPVVAFAEHSDAGSRVVERNNASASAGEQDMVSCGVDLHVGSRSADVDVAWDALDCYEILAVVLLGGRCEVLGCLLPYKY